MKKVVLTLAVLLIFAMGAYACDGDSSAKSASSCSADKKMETASTQINAQFAADAKMEDGPRHVDIEGQVVCVFCDLKKEKGANAACKLFGHVNGLKTKDGKYISFLENNQSEDLIKSDQYANKTVTVHGTFYPSANMLDIESFDVDGHQLSWCENHHAMDACASMK